MRAVRKRHFFSHLYIKCIILPRQARDKHRKSTQKKCRFPSGGSDAGSQPTAAMRIAHGENVSVHNTVVEHTSSYGIWLQGGAEPSHAVSIFLTIVLSLYWQIVDS
jgi:hypothetical protein